MRFGVLYPDGSINICSNQKGENHAWSEAMKEARDANCGASAEGPRAQVIRIAAEPSFEIVDEVNEPDPAPTKHPGHP